MKQAIVLAGGKGTRLYPYTVVFPKPMLPIGGKPILETILKQLKYFGFENVTLSLGYMPGLIQSYFEGMVIDDLPKLEYVTEKKPLGTSGPVKEISPEAENFLVMNGDILSTLDLSKMYQFHEENDALLTLAVRKADYTLPLGIIETDSKGIVTDFKEKPVISHYDNLGIYIYNKKVLDYMNKDEHIDVNNLVIDLINKKEKVQAFRSEEPYYWIDIGRHGDYETANEEFQKIQDAFPFLK